MAVTMGCARSPTRQFAHRVLFGRVVEIGLHGAGFGHHVPRHRASGWHVFPHDGVSQLGYPAELFDGRERVAAEAEPHEPEVIHDGLEAGPVCIGLGLAFVYGSVRGARELYLRPGFESHGGVVATQRDDWAAFRLALGCPAVLANELLENRHYADGAVVREVCAGTHSNRDSFGFGADPPPLTWLFRVVEQREQVIHPA